MTRISAILIFVLFLQCLRGNSATSNNTEVVLVHIIFRHGDRTTYGFYPTDPHINETFFPVGLGGLTNKGKTKEFTLGNVLRKEYDQFLGKYYYQDILEVRSTDTSRTIMSALLVLAGLWQPFNEQKWNSDLLWQPIPVFAKPLKEEDLLDATHCEFRKLVIENQSKDEEIIEKFVKPHKALFDHVEKHSGRKINSLLDIQDMYFTLSCEDEFGLELPKWTKEIYPKPIYEASSFIYNYLNVNPDVKKIHAGYLLQKMINDSVAKINNEQEPKGRKMFLYAGHDTTLGYMLEALKVLKPQIPPYGSAVILELHKRGHEYLFKLRYLTDPMIPTIEDMSIPGCDVLCPVNKFIELQTEILPIIGYKEACDVRNSTF